MLNKCMFGVFV